MLAIFGIGLLCGIVLTIVVIKKLSDNLSNRSGLSYVIASAIIGWLVYKVIHKEE